MASALSKVAIYIPYRNRKLRLLLVAYIPVKPYAIICLVSSYHKSMFWFILRIEKFRVTSAVRLCFPLACVYTGMAPSY